MNKSEAKPSKQPGSSVSAAKELPKLAPTADFSKSVTKSSMAVDPESFDVDGILSHHILPRNGIDCLRYRTSWIGYGADDNTDEPERSFQTYLPIYTYWRKVVKSKDRNIDGKELAFGAVVQHELQNNSLRFYVADSMFYKKLISEQFGRKYGWLNMKKTFAPTPEFPEMNDLMARYTQDLTVLIRCCKHFPDVQVINTVDGILPMSLKQFIPFNVTPDVDMFTWHSVVQTADVYPGLIPSKTALVHSAMWFMMDQRAAYRESSGEKDSQMEECRIQLAFDPSSLTADTPFPRSSLQVRRHPDGFWELITLYPINAGDVISPICGEIVDVSVADKCFREEGEMIAFTHFLELPNAENLCLDRRRRSDFTRYLHHSCKPNCIVKAVLLESTSVPGKSVSTLHLVAARAIPENSVLTVNFFNYLPPPLLTTKAAYMERFHLETKGIDTVWCNCDAGQSLCRGVLWREVQNTKKDYEAPKEQKIKTSKVSGGQFRGLSIYDEKYRMEL